MTTPQSRHGGQSWLERAEASHPCELPLAYFRIVLNVDSPCLTNPPDTVGHPPNAENSASHMLSLKAQKPQGSNAITVAVSRENRMTNNIWAFSEPRGLMYFFISEVL